MATIVLRNTKGSPLTIAEVDSNFSNLNSSKLEITSSTGSAALPLGTTTQRDATPAPGYLRFNSETTSGEIYNGSAWLAVGGISVGDDTTTDATYYPTLASSTNGVNATLRVSSTKLSFNPSTGVLTATGFAGSGASLSSLDASKLSSGIVPTTRLAGGTASASNFLRGDQNWAAIAAGDISSGTIATARLGSGSAIATTYLRGDQTWSSVDWTHISNKPDPVVTVTLTGDATGTANTTLTDVGNGTISVSTTISSIAGNLTVGGNLIVNGTTTTVNSTTTTLDDPIITLGGDVAPTVDDNKDRGVEFRWHNGTNAKVGFFGFDDSTGKFTFVPDATNASEVFSGAKGTIDATIEWVDVLNKPDPVYAFQNAAIGTDSDYTWGTANTNTTQAADTSSDTLTFVNGGGINLYTNTVAGTDAIKIEHADTSSVANLSSNNSGSTFIQDVSFTFDTYGHVTAASVATATALTSQSNDFGTVAVTDTDTGYTWSTTGSASADSTGDTLTLVSGTDIEVNVDGTLDAIRFAHKNVSRTNNTSSSSPGYGGSFTVVDSITTSASGHITAVNTKTVTLPSVDDTNTTYAISAETATGGANIRLTGSDATTDDVKIAAGTNISITRTDANTITIDSTSSGATITNDTTTDGLFYPAMAASTTGALATAYVSDAKLSFNPSTGTLSSTTFNSLSDQSLKTDIAPIADARTTINSLSGVEFKWIENGQKSAGVIAQQLEQILPHLVETNNTGIKTVNYSGIIAYLIEAVKQQDRRIEHLERLLNN